MTRERHSAGPAPTGAEGPSLGLETVLIELDEAHGAYNDEADGS
jgi:hypothetical protein